MPTDTNAEHVAHFFPGTEHVADGAEYGRDALLTDLVDAACRYSGDIDAMGVTVAFRAILDADTALVNECRREAMTHSATFAGFPPTVTLVPTLEASTLPDDLAAEAFHQGWDAGYAARTPSDPASVDASEEAVREAVDYFGETCDDSCDCNPDEESGNHYDGYLGTPQCETLTAHRYLATITAALTTLQRENADLRARVVRTEDVVVSQRAKIDRTKAVAEAAAEAVRQCSHDIGRGVALVPKDAYIALVNAQRELAELDGEVAP